LRISTSAVRIVVLRHSNHRFPRTAFLALEWNVADEAIDVDPRPPQRQHPGNIGNLSTARTRQADPGVARLHGLVDREGAPIGIGTFHGGRHCTGRTTAGISMRGHAVGSDFWLREMYKDFLASPLPEGLNRIEKRLPSRKIESGVAPIPCDLLRSRQERIYWACARPAVLPHRFGLLNGRPFLRGLGWAAVVHRLCCERYRLFERYYSIPPHGLSDLGHADLP
jgi:hypothetical protein